MDGRPTLSVVMPVLNGRNVLPGALDALNKSDLPREDWELLVIDDGSTDGTADWLESRADRVLCVQDGPRGPGFARNAAALEARGSILVFLDADVRIHPGALRVFRDTFAKSEEVGAVFGAYDRHPEAPGFLSQYRNLYHRFVHLAGAGEAETFWAGLGAVRRDLFTRLGGFDTVTYARPQIEDIELGYRIRDAGYRIILDPRIQGSHLKRWTLRSIVRTDLLDRGVPWMRLVLRDSASGRSRPSLNVSRGERVKVLLTGLASAILLGAGLLQRPSLAIAALLPLLVIILMNLNLYRWFAGERGWAFALRVIPMNLLYYFLNGLSVVLSIPLHLADRLRQALRRTEPEGAKG